MLSEALDPIVKQLCGNRYIETTPLKSCEEIPHGWRFVTQSGSIYELKEHHEETLPGM